MNISAKVEQMLEDQIDGVFQVLSQDCESHVNWARELSCFSALVEVLDEFDVSNDNILLNLLNAAAISGLLYDIKQSILADDEIAEEELVQARMVLKDCLYRWTDIFDDYAHFSPLVSTSETLGLIGMWEDDQGFFGGDFSEDSMALFGPFQRFVTLAGVVDRSVSLVRDCRRSSMLIMKMIIAEGGIEASEKEVLAEADHLWELSQNVIEAVIADSEEAVTSTISPSMDNGDETPSESRDEILQSARTQLNNLVGLDSVKVEVQRVANFLEVNRQREEAGLPVPEQTMHFVFTGNPGTGKTTVARLLATILYGYGVLDTDAVIETDRGNLGAGFVGQTAIKTKEVIDTALNGVLFIDEAYTLSGSDGQDFGQEAIDTLLKAMEDHRDQLVVIAAGYPDLMKTFISSNPGLESRFTRFIQFDDYHVSEMYRIYQLFCDQNEYRLAPQAMGNLAILLNSAFEARDESFGNGRFVRNLYERTLGNHSDRLVGQDSVCREDLTTIQHVDLPFDLAGVDGPFDVKDSMWMTECPGCGSASKAPLKMIGKRVKCKCGTRFVCPSWNLVPATVPGLEGFVEHGRESDMGGEAVS